MGKFNQLNLLLPEVKDAELLKKKGHEFQIKGGGEEASSSPAIHTRPNAVLLPPPQGFPINVTFVLRFPTLCDIALMNTMYTVTKWFSTAGCK